ncbi:hypothetical protein ACFQ3Z_05425 [Streptomyces nogalater]
MTAPWVARGWGTAGRSAPPSPCSPPPWPFSRSPATPAATAPCSGRCSARGTARAS